MLVGLAVESPPQSGTGAIFYLLGILLTGALSGFGFQFYKFRKQEKREDDTLIAKATTEAVAAVREVLGIYKAELDRAKKDVERLEDKYDEANARIIQLRADLDIALEDRDHLQSQLQEAVQKRADALAELRVLRHRVEELSTKVDETGV